MVTGVECAGLILAVLPIVVQAAQVYSGGVEDIRDVVESSRSNEKLEEFYERFFWEVSEFEYQIKQIIDALPKISDERKSRLVANLHMNDWAPSSDVAQALQEYFGTTSDFMKFELVMKKCVKLIGQLVEDKQTTNIEKSDLNPDRMFQKLKDYAASRKGKQPSRKFKDRYRFRVKEKDREKCLQALKEWNGKLLVVSRRAQKEVTVKKPVSSSPTRPSGHLRDLSCVLYRALSNYWNCGCTTRHEARFCLRSKKGLHKCPDPSELDFSLLFSTPTTAAGVTWGWQEGKVLVRSRRNVPGPASKVRFQIDTPECDEERAELQRICDAVEAAQRHGHCLQLLVEDLGDQQYLWQLPPQPRQLRFFESTEAVVLQTLLQGANELPLKEKRMLALILAYSLLQLCGSPWLNEPFSKEQITFFKSADELDYDRPYISTRFDESTTAAKRPDMNRLHRNPSILSLGILLLELHKERPIEAYRKPDDLINGTQVNVNTDYTVVDREVKKLKDCSLDYQEAIQACLDMPWKPTGRISMDDPATRNGVYDCIIRPLEDELKNLFRETM